MEESRRERIIITLGMLYEWMSTSLMNENTQGYVLRKIQEGKVEEIPEEVIGELETLSLLEELSHDDAMCLRKIVLSYRSQGITENFMKDIISSIKANSKTKEAFENNAFFLKNLLSYL